MCISKLAFCHLTVNLSKSTCMRLGPRHDISKCAIVISGHLHSWVRELTFLGFVIVAGNSFKCKLQINKQKFFASPTLYLVVSTVHVKDVNHTTLSMIYVFCIPVLLYGLEALDVNSASIKATDFVYNDVFVQLFCVTDNKCIVFVSANAPQCVCQHLTGWMYVYPKLFHVLESWQIQSSSYISLLLVRGQWLWFPARYVSVLTHHCTF